MRPSRGGRQATGGDLRRGEVLQELRVVGAGALVLLVFLLSISFTSRFTGLSAVQRAMYVTSAVLAAVAAVLLLVPAAYPRLVPGHRPAGQVSRAVSGVAAGGLAAAGLAVSAAVRLAARWAGPGLAADLLGAGTAVLFAVAWFAFPWLLNRGSWPGRNGRLGGPAGIRRKGQLARARARGGVSWHPQPSQSLHRQGTESENDASFGSARRPVTGLVILPPVSHWRAEGSWRTW